MPAAIFIRRFDYKTGVLLGLGLFALGGLLFYPASHSMLYEHFLTALFVLASGLSILETSANPYVLTMGPPETATRRLSLAQSFNPLGSIVGVLIGKFFILTGLDPATEAMRRNMPEELLRSIQISELQAVMGPYLICAAVIILLWMLIGALLALLVVFVGGMAGIYSLVLISGCMANMFPLIYGLSLADSGEELSLGGSGMIMAILGGAVMTGFMGGYFRQRWNTGGFSGAYDQFWLSDLLRLLLYCRRG